MAKNYVMISGKRIVSCMIACAVLAGCGKAQPQISAAWSGQKTSETITSQNTLSSPKVTAIQKSQSTPGTVTISMVGDVLLHMPIENAAVDSDGFYDFNFLFENMTDEIKVADVAIVNQEVILGGEDLGISGYPCFNAPFEVGDALVHSGFDVVCHGTNHALDKGKTGIINSYNFWKDNYPNITVLGINASQEEKDTVKIIEKNGIKIALLNYTYGTNGIPLPKDMTYAVDLLVEDKVVKDLKYAEENADFTVVCPHWGTEYNLGTDKSQAKWAEIFRENGADLVIGTHPHVIEPIEMMEDSNPGITNNHGNGDMLVYYSLGNFCSWTSSSGKNIANRMVGGMAQITITRDDNGEVVIADYGVRALVCHLTGGYHGATVYPLSKYTDEMGKESRIKTQDGAFSRDYCVDLCNKVWGNGWK
ncbi:CapA family protein [Butyrivibrio sp. VCB2006]|uniref:CapA family protein n=1 Tax=Butyrivibrio sp. VCB2006 TaxID=1280679 RepID=UPI000401B1AA|nr:CapA family protein [Butyrivibrio sp. VCB2006]